MSGKSKPRASVVLTQRERFSAMRESLASLFENTAEPFELIVVTGAAPARVRRWLADEAAARGFRHVDAGRPLTPAEARNLGLGFATCDYVAFVENDIIYRKGWLGALLACADETGAALAAPLTCEGRPAHTIIHHVGPVETNREDFIHGGDGQRDFEEEFFLQGKTLDEAGPLLTRRRTQCVEMHCFLARRDLFNRVGEFDPDIVSKEYLDFSWRVRALGETIWVEPAAVITFLIPSEADPIRFADLPSFLLRWSPGWQKRSHDALKAKWGLKEDGFVAARRAKADWRIVAHLTKPTLARVPLLGRRWGFVTRAAAPLNWALTATAALLSWRYDQARRRSERGGQSVRSPDMAPRQSAVGS